MVLERKSREREEIKSKVFASGLKKKKLRERERERKSIAYL